MKTARDIAFQNEILRGEVGSSAHGMAIEGTDDIDQMGVFIEPPEYVCGLSSCDHYVYRDAKEGERSKPGELDLTLYSLRKFCRLATAGNPSVIVLLWLDHYPIETAIGEELVSIRKLFISKESGKRFLGYLTAQKKSLTGERTQKVNRPELVEKYGYDVKFASHALRLGIQGIQLLREERLSLPIDEPWLGILRAIKEGKVTYKAVIDMIESAESELKYLIDKCNLVADKERIDKWLVKAHKSWWKHV